jgi:hypothetical protein
MQIFDIVFGQLGRCRKCTRSAFLMALTGWTTAAGALSFLLYSGPTVWTNWMLAATSAAAVAFTLLWIAHLAAFGLRMIASPPNRLEAPGSRRAFLSRYGQVVVGAALMTSIAPIVGTTMIARVAQAKGESLVDGQDDRYHRICKSNCGLVRITSMAGCPVGPDGDDCRAQLEQSFQDCITACS